MFFKITRNSLIFNYLQPSFFLLSKILYNYFRELFRSLKIGNPLYVLGVREFPSFIYFLEKLWWTQKKSVPLHVKLKKTEQYENSK